MKPVRLALSFLGRQIILTDDNCTLYRFRSQHEIDHLYFTVEEDEDGETQGYFIFEREDLCGMWERNYGHVDTRIAPTQADIDAYAHWQAESIDDELGGIL
jgi:hypothetical protein